MERLKSRYLSDEDIYDIQPVNDLSELLKDGCSLCLVWAPAWNRKKLQLPQIRGRLNGQQGVIYYAQDSAGMQVSTKNRLDHFLDTPYLFTSWKQNGGRAFRITLHGKVLQEFSVLSQALAELLPGHFAPEFSYRRKISIGSQMLLEARRRRDHRVLCRQLLGLLNVLQQKKGDLAPGKPHDG